MEWKTGPVRAPVVTTRSDRRTVVGRGKVTPAHSSKVDQCVENLCSQGCSRVYGYIADLQDGVEFPEVEGLDREERRQVLKELISVMAAYNGSCGN